MTNFWGDQNRQQMVPRPTYGGVSPLMQQLIGEGAREDIGLGLGEEPSWTGLGDVRDPRSTQQRQETGFSTRQTFTGVDDIVNALRAGQISPAQAQGYLEQIMTPDVARAFLERNFPADTEEAETVSGAATLRYADANEVYAAVKNKTLGYWDGVDALVALGRDRAGAAAWLGPLIEGYTDRGNGGKTREEELYEAGLARQQAAAEAAAAERQRLLNAQGLDGGDPRDPGSQYQAGTGGMYDVSMGQGIPVSSRESAFLEAEKEPWNVYDRFLSQQPMGQLSALGRQGLARQYQPAYQSFLAQATRPEATFRDFLGGAGPILSQEGLQAQLGKIADIFQVPELDRSDVQSFMVGPKRFGSNEIALAAYLNPLLARTNPLFRGAVQGVGEDWYNRFMAATPERSIMPALSQRGGFFDPQ